MVVVDGIGGRTTEKEKANKVKITDAKLKSTKTREIEFKVIGTLKKPI